MSDAADVEWPKRSKGDQVDEFEKGVDSTPISEIVAPDYNYDSVVQEPLGQFGRYSIFVLIVVQMGMVAVAGIMMSTSYHKIIPKWTCNPILGSNFTMAPLSEGGNWVLFDDDCECPEDNRIYTNKDGFFSFSRTFGLYCEDGKKGFHFATYIMVGGLVGAIIFGQLADSFGRKFTAAIALAGTLLFSFIFMFVQSFTVACVIIAVTGFFGGGYMVVGVVTLIEFVGKDYRLFVSCFHGWPYGFMYMSLIGFLTKNWRYYHLAMSLTGIPFVLGWLFMVESPRWLIRMNKLKQAGGSIAKMAKFNGGKSVSADLETLQKLYDVESRNREKLKGFTYWDLFSYPSVLKLVLSLAFVWFASGIISWGIYVNLGALSGTIYLNFFLTGLFKALAGSILPLGFNLCLGRRPIILSGIVVSCSCMWGMTGIFIYQNTKAGALGFVVTILSIISVAAMDPTWKINHLYSSELFPTVVRNMSNGVCNMGSRIASIISPLVASLEHEYLPAPFIVLGILGVLQFLVAFFFLPETKGMPLPDSLPPKNRKRRMGGEDSICENKAFDDINNECSNEGKIREVAV